MTEPEHDTEHEPELAEPDVADVPEPDQPLDDPEADEAESEAHEAAHEPTELSVAEGRTPEQWEKLWKDTERAFAAYTKKVTALWEEDALALTPFNLDPYSPPGFLNMEHAGRIDDETQAAAMGFLGVPREQEYEADPEAAACQVCKGKGLTATGSLVGTNRTRNCPACQGIGYLVRGVAATNGTSPVSSSHVPVNEQVAALSSPADDPFGEPEFLPNGERNENLGKMPQFKKPHPVYGITALLSQSQGAN